MPGDYKRGCGLLPRIELHRADQGPDELGAKRLPCGQIAAEDALRRAGGNRGVTPIGILWLEKRQTERAVIVAAIQGNLGRPGCISLLDLVDVDMSPAAGMLIHDLDPCRLAGQVANVPRRPL